MIDSFAFFRFNMKVSPFRNFFFFVISEYVLYIGNEENGMKYLKENDYNCAYLSYNKREKNRGKMIRFINYD